MKPILSIVVISLGFAAACAKRTSEPEPSVASCPQSQAPEREIAADSHGPAPSTDEKTQAIREGVARMVSGIKGCYDGERAAQPNKVSGRVKLKLTVNARGAVTSARVIESFLPSADACAIKVAEQTSFSRKNVPFSHDDITFTVPFSFE